MRSTLDGAGETDTLLMHQTKTRFSFDLPRGERTKLLRFQVRVGGKTRCYNAFSECDIFFSVKTSLIVKVSFLRIRRHQKLDILEKATRIKHSIGKYRASEIVIRCVQQLNQADAGSETMLKTYPPWLLLLLIKWSLLYGVEYEGLHAQPFQDADFVGLVKSFQELNDFVRMPSEYENVFLFLRNMAYQQFWLQEQFPIQGIARQRVIFGSLPTNDPLQEQFLSTTHVSINDFLELAVVTMAAFFIQKRAHIEHRWYSPVVDKYSENTIQHFLSSVSMTIPNIKRFLQTKQKPESLNYEFYERTPLKRFPMLELNSQFYPYHRNLLAASFHSFTYDVLRSPNPEAFMRRFGDMFQKYIEQVLLAAKIEFLTEKEIQAALGLSGKSVDFLITENEGNIFIDAKGVEMSRIGMLTHMPDVISDKSKSSVLKGITQGYELAQKLPAGTRIRERTINTDENYLLIITYSEFYVGNGTDFYNYIDSRRLDEIVTNYGRQHWIPFEHMYFLSIDDLEWCLEYARLSKKSLIEILRDAVRDDRTPDTRKLTFGQHIGGKFQPMAFQPPVLKVALDSMMVELKQVIEKHESSD